MDIDKQIEDLCKYVDKDSRDSACLAEVDKNMANFHQDVETVVNDLQLKCEDIDRRRAGYQEEIKVLTEKMEVLETQLREAEVLQNDAGANGQMSLTLHSVSLRWLFLRDGGVYLL